MRWRGTWRITCNLHRKKWNQKTPMISFNFHFSTRSDHIINCPSWPSCAEMYIECDAKNQNFSNRLQFTLKPKVWGMVFRQNSDWHKFFIMLSLVTGQIRNFWMTEDNHDMVAKKDKRKILIMTFKVRKMVEISRFRAHAKIAIISDIFRISCWHNTSVLNAVCVHIRVKQPCWERSLKF